MHILGRFRDAAAVEAIRNLLPTMEPRDRVAAIAALGRIGTSEALAAVLEARYDPSGDVRRMVVIALGRIARPEAFEHLKGIEAEDQADYVRAQASRVLRASSKNAASQ